MSYTLTTTPITLDVVAAVCISAAIQDRIDLLERRLERMKRKTGERRRLLENQIANTKRGLDAFDPAYRACINAPTFTPEYQALIDAVAE